MLDVVKIPVTTTGSAGSATGNEYSPRPISGQIQQIYVAWDAAAPATSTITVTIEADDNHPAITLYSKANNKTAVWVYPQVQATGTDGAGLTNWYQPIVGQGRVKAAVSACDPLAVAVTVYVYIEGRN